MWTVGSQWLSVMTSTEQNFTLLLAELRAQLDAYGNGVGRRMWLTAATPAGQDKLATIETDKIGQYLDYNNVMTYDMHGGWDATGPTNFQDPLYQAPNDPSTPIPPGTAKYSVDGAVEGLDRRRSGVRHPRRLPGEQADHRISLLLQGMDEGLSAGASNRQLPDGYGTGGTVMRLSGNVPGVSFYKELTGFVDNPSSTYFDDGDHVVLVLQRRHLLDRGQRPLRSRRRPTTSTATAWPARSCTPSRRWTRTRPCSTRSSTRSTRRPLAAADLPRPPRPPHRPPHRRRRRPPPHRRLLPRQHPRPRRRPPLRRQHHRPQHGVRNHGSLVSYDGVTYWCIQGHTSLTGWEPPNVPALWGRV